MGKLYESSKIYLDGPEGLRNEVEMWYAGACLFLNEIVKQNNKSLFGGLHEKTGIELREKLGKYEVLDVCCGPGNFANYVSLVYPDIKVTGIDLNEEFLNSARDRFGKFGWEFIREDFRYCDLNKKFKFILASSAYHHIPNEDKTRFMKNGGYHLKPNGKIIMCENFIPYYSDAGSKKNAINNYYKKLKEYYKGGNGTKGGISAINEVHQLELLGKEEHKVHFKKFEEDIRKADLKIEQDKVIWQPKEFRKDNAGSHVLLLQKIDLN